VRAKTLKMFNLNHKKQKLFPFAKIQKIVKGKSFLRKKSRVEELGFNPAFCQYNVICRRF